MLSKYECSSEKKVAVAEGIIKVGKKITEIIITFYINI